jgi:hypothetical protein
MKLRFGILGLVFLLGLGADGGGCSGSPVGVQDYGTITGRVVDAATNKPIGGALVSVGSLYTGYADPQGAFTLSAIPTGTQTVTARSPGYGAGTADILVRKDQTVSVDYIKLQAVVQVGPTPLPPSPASQSTPSPAAT